MDISIDDEERLSSKVDDLAERLSIEEMKGLEEALEKNDFEVQNMTGLRGFGISPHKRNRIVSELKGLEPSEQFALRLALKQARKKKHLEKSALELCWTGPRKGITVRRTEQALTELLTMSEERIDILGYYVSPYADRLTNLIKKKLEEGVKTTMIINNLEEKQELIRWIENLSKPLEIYDWEGSDIDSILHAKCILSDQKRAFIGSSNFTYHGMRRNIEMGLLVEDEGVIKKMIKLIENIIHKSKRIQISER